MLIFLFSTGKKKTNKKPGYLTEYVIGHNCYLAITVFLCRLWIAYHEVAYFIFATDLRGTEDLKLNEITSENCKSKRCIILECPSVCVPVRGRVGESCKDLNYFHD